MDSKFGFTDDDDESLFGGFSFSNIVVDELKAFVKIDNNDNGIKKRGTWESYYEEEEEEDDDDDLTEALLIQMGYGKTGPPKHEPPPTPLPSDNLKSAMKGSAKKEGVEDKDLKVSWAEDVYDPTPSSDSHFASNRTERHKNEGKKSGKNRQKGGGKGPGGGELGGLKGGKDKDKKDKKRGGGSGGGGAGARSSKDKDKKQIKKYGGKCWQDL